MVNNLREGETFVAGRSKAQARELLDAADAKGYDAAVVRVANGGYIVPSDLVEDAPEEKKAEPKKTTRRPRRTEKES